MEGSVSRRPGRARRSSSFDRFEEDLYEQKQLQVTRKNVELDGRLCNDGLSVEPQRWLSVYATHNLACRELLIWNYSIRRYFLTISHDNPSFRAFPNALVLEPFTSAVILLHVTNEYVLRKNARAKMTSGPYCVSSIPLSERDFPNDEAFLASIDIRLVKKLFLDCTVLTTTAVPSRDRVFVVPNRSLLPFTVLGAIGQGKVGSVFKVFHTIFHRVLAVKEIALNQFEKGMEKQLKNEINIMHFLDHPYIVRYYGMAIVENSQLEPPTLYIFMDFVQRGSLNSYIKSRGALTEEQAKRYVRHMLLGLEYMHSNGIVHRDLKCSNLLLSKDNTVHLADFGTSSFIYHEVRETSGIGEQMGTPHWSAPEALKGSLSPSGWRKADIWSAGCIVIEMLTGDHPWPEFDDPSVALYQIPLQRHGPPYPRNISEDLTHFFSKCFALNPKDRLETMALLSHPWLKSAADHMLLRVGSLTSFERPVPQDVFGDVEKHISVRVRDDKPQSFLQFLSSDRDNKVIDVTNTTFGTDKLTEKQKMDRVRSMMVVMARSYNSICSTVSLIRDPYVETTRMTSFECLHFYDKLKLYSSRLQEMIARCSRSTQASVDAACPEGSAGRRRSSVSGMKPAESAAAPPAAPEVDEDSDPQRIAETNTKLVFQWLEDIRIYFLEGLSGCYYGIEECSNILGRIWKSHISITQSVKVLGNLIDDLDIYLAQCRRPPEDCITEEELLRIRKRHKHFARKYSTQTNVRLQSAVRFLYDRATQMKELFDENPDSLCFFTFKEAEVQAGAETPPKRPGGSFTGQTVLVQAVPYEQRSGDSFLNSEYFRDDMMELSVSMANRTIMNSGRDSTDSREEREAIGSYIGGGQEELTIHTGDIINVTAKDESGWWYGECRDQCGWFPSTFLRTYE